MQQPLTDPVHGSSEPDRFWTTTNVAEATPDLLSPLCWDIWSDGLEKAWLRSMFDFGLLAKHETELEADPNKRSTAAIYGRQAANVAVIRRVMGRLPGVDPDDVERDLLGSVRPGLPKEDGAGRRLPIIATRLPWVMVRTNALVHRMHDRNRQWWRYGVDETHSSTAPLEQLARASQMFAEAMNLHSRIRFLLPAAEQAVTAIAEKSGLPDAAAALVGGFGNVAETALADDLWRVSRGELTQAQFLAEYGFHGPNEGNVYTRSWREQPERVAALIGSYQARTDIPRPRDLERSAMQARADSKRCVLAAMSPALRPALTFALHRLGNLTRNMELTKASYLRALDGARAAARLLGEDLYQHGILADPDDAFFLTIDEHRRLARGECSGIGELVAYRRSQRAVYAGVDVPVSFTGMPEMAAAATQADSSGAPTSLTGNAGGCGTVEGRARVVMDANADVDLESGDILVCRSTDPSWAALFVCAAGLVIDIGSSTSHGAVVARELGIPYVIGTGNGTAAIGDGDRIRVDGTERTVSIMTSVT